MLAYGPFLFSFKCATARGLLEGPSATCMKLLMLSLLVQE